MMEALPLMVLLLLFAISNIGKPATSFLLSVFFTALFGWLALSWTSSSRVSRDGKKELKNFFRFQWLPLLTSGCAEELE